MIWVNILMMDYAGENYALEKVCNQEVFHQG
jgi:hypothetical protein